MKIVEFPCGSDLSYGMGWDIECEITDEEYELLKSKQEEVFHLYEDKELEEIEDKVLKLVIENEIFMVKKEPYLIEQYIHDEDLQEKMKTEGYNDFVDSYSDEELEEIITRHCSFYVNMPELED